MLASSVPKLEQLENLQLLSDVSSMVMQLDKPDGRDQKQLEDQRKFAKDIDDACITMLNLLFKDGDVGMCAFGIIGPICQAIMALKVSGIDPITLDIATMLSAEQKVTAILTGQGKHTQAAKKLESGFDDDLGELDQTKACKVSDPDCEGCQ